MEIKKCGNCKKEFPKTEEYFFKKIYKQKDKNGLISNYTCLRSTCKKCHSLLATEKSHRKRFKELNCTIENYKEKYFEIIAYKKLKYKELFGVRKTRVHSIREKINDGYVFTTIEQYEKDCKDNVRIAGLKKRKYNYNTDEKVTTKMMNHMSCKMLVNSRIALILKLKTKEIPKEIIEVKRNIILLKRELKTIKN